MAVETSGGLPIFTTELRLGELVATLALAQDNAFGQPLESQLRSCLLGVALCEEAGFEAVHALGLGLAGSDDLQPQRADGQRARPTVGAGRLHQSAHAPPTYL